MYRYFLEDCDVHTGEWIIEKEKNVGGTWFYLVVDWMGANLNVSLQSIV